MPPNPAIAKFDRKVAEAFVEHGPEVRSSFGDLQAVLLTQIPLDILTIGKRASPKNFDAGIESRQLNPAFG
jgi:hypothetical protein